MNRFMAYFIALGIAVAPAAAHEGPRIWLGNVAGQVATFTSDNDLDPTVYTPLRLFTTELQQFFGIYTTEFPGYEVRQDGGDVDAGTTFGFNITGPLLYFDDATDTFVTVAEMFGPPQPGPVPQMAVSLGATIRTTNAGPVAGFNFFTFHEIGDHSHLSYTLLGDGVNAGGGPAGVYALPMNVASATLATSETYYLLIGKEVAETAPLFLDAYAIAQITLVPAEMPGDMNCDGAVNEADIPAFVLALLDPAAYSAAYPGCDPTRADLNTDGESDALDLQPFVDAMAD